MKKRNYPANLALDAAFIKRAVELRGGQNLDSAFLADLLKAGLAFMELSAGSHDERCGNADCGGCRIRRREQPSPATMAEFMEMQERLNEMAEARKAGACPDREVTFAVSETSLVFMAWLDRLVRQQGSGKLRIAGPDIDLDRPADMEGAMRFLTHMVVCTLEDSMNAFAEGRHPLLFPPHEGANEPTLH